MTFHVGQKVVCIDDQPRPAADPRKNPGGIWVPNWPRAGRIYTIRSVGNRSDCLLVEVVNPIRAFSCGECEGSFLTDRFRPIVEKKTDISIFTAMLNPKKARERA